MLNKIYYLQHKQMIRSIVVLEDSFIISSKKEKSLEDMKVRVGKKSIMHSAEEFPLSAIAEITSNESSEKFVFRYEKKNGKLKKRTMLFDKSNIANEVAELLANQGAMIRSEKPENKIYPMLGSGFLLSVTILLTGFMLSIDDASILDSTAEGYSRSARRSRSGGALMKFLYETLGHTGIAIVGSAIAFGIIYYGYNRWKNPATVMGWTKGKTIEM